jgi:ParB-like chromosome segregation protein Spo0J
MMPAAKIGAPPKTEPPHSKKAVGKENLQWISIESLQFDPKNPRVVELLGPKPTQTQIEQLLLGGDMRARELMPSFMENGYIPYEPLVVRPHNSRFTVIEGNRRLAAIRALMNSEDAEEVEAFKRHGLSSVPCLIFQGDDRQLLAYLGLRHLSKTKDWGTNAKGAFVERIIEAGFNLREAARLTNTSTGSLRLILLTRRLFEEASSLGFDLPASGADGETIFWHLGDAVRRSRTKAYLRLTEDPEPLETPNYDQTKFEYLIGWLYGNRKTGQQRVIDSIRDIKSLDECLGNERAVTALESGSSLTEAQEELEAAGATIIGHLEKAKRSLKRALSGTAEIDLDGIEQVETASRQLREAHDQLDASIQFRRKFITKNI